MKLGTKAVHAGQTPEAGTGAVIPPPYQTTTFLQNHPGEPVGAFEYTRAGNPSFSRLEEVLAALENGQHATVFSSGCGAMTAWLAAIGKCHLVTNEDLYGGTYRLLHDVFANYGVASTAVRTDAAQGWLDAMGPETKWLLIETPTNPLLKLVDLPTLCRTAHSRNVRVLVDNTFATPCFQTPLDLGADAVLHSTTKYLGGHSDVVGGALVTNDTALKKQFDFSRKALGLNPSPFDCWLISRGVKTLALRMAQHEKNALAIARRLADAPGVAEVLYPGLPSHPQHALAKGQMRGFGGIVTLRLHDAAAARSFIERLTYFHLAESLGGVESLVCQPYCMTHASMPAELRARLGIDETLVRLSVGIEETDDLVADVANAAARL